MRPARPEFSIKHLAIGSFHHALAIWNKPVVGSRTSLIQARPRLRSRCFLGFLISQRLHAALQQACVLGTTWVTQQMGASGVDTVLLPFAFQLVPCMSKDGSTMPLVSHPATIVLRILVHHLAVTMALIHVPHARIYALNTQVGIAKSCGRIVLELTHAVPHSVLEITSVDLLVCGHLTNSMVLSFAELSFVGDALAVYQATRAMVRILGPAPFVVRPVCHGTGSLAVPEVIQPLALIRVLHLLAPTLDGQRALSRPLVFPPLALEGDATLLAAISASTVPAPSFELTFVHIPVGKGIFTLTLLRWLRLDSRNWQRMARHPSATIVSAKQPVLQKVDTMHGYFSLLRAA
mmetsp:Transcript_38111/g.89295  ORF Transcript_38111/g.89295 Transcript_38111/m.89295 type:complete len:349 (-) Transcript_38111:2159-3205(-)